MNKKKKYRPPFVGNIYLLMCLYLTVAMLMLSLCRILFFLFNADLFPDMTFGHFAHLMHSGLRFDLTAMLYTNILFIAGFVLPFRFRHNRCYQQTLKMVFYITNSVAIASNCVDFVYFRYTMRRTTWSVFQEFSNDGGNIALLGRFFAEYWYMPILLAAMIYFMIWLCRQLANKLGIYGKRVNKSGNYMSLLRWQVYYPLHTVLMALSLALFVGGVRGGFTRSTRPITISNAAAYVRQPAETGIVLSTPFSIYRTLNHPAYKRIEWFDAATLDSIYQPIRYPHDSANFTGKNVVIIIVESLSKEYIGTFNRELDGGRYRGYTPFLDSLIAHSRTFAHSFGNGMKSIDAMPSVLASIPSFPDPYVLSIYSNNTIKGLATLLAEKGYDCSFFHGAPNGSMGFDAFAQSSGFQHYYGKDEYGNNNDFDGLWAIWDEPFLQFTAHTLNSKTEPFLGAVFTATSHHPFRVPDHCKDLFPKGTEEIHQCVGYTDRALQRFFETASQMEWFKNTIFVITADHTNQVSYPKSKTSIGGFVIPVIYYDPSGIIGTGIDTMRVTQQIDIMPTILGLLNYDKPYFAFGFDAFARDTAQTNFVINYNGFYNIYNDSLLLQIRDGQLFAMFNYSADTLLTDNILARRPKESATLLQQYRAFHQTYIHRLETNTTQY
ncbi:MAG: LTA synthase family protein [Prevotellaceae bacterium]|jgi:phosphoglycerol transferase MdoB-like AlkP superfamily enzyme|nr:LTA synthase family protein [Prevotellaceae bacterium]